MEPKKLRKKKTKIQMKVEVWEGPSEIPKPVKTRQLENKEPIRSAWCCCIKVASLRVFR